MVARERTTNTALMRYRVGLALVGMFVSAWLSSRRLARIRVVEALREL